MSNIQITSNINKQWKLFCENNNLSHMSYCYEKVQKYISDLTFKDYDNLIKEFTSRSIVICPKCKDTDDQTKYFSKSYYEYMGWNYVDSYCFDCDIEKIESEE